MCSLGDEVAGELCVLLSVAQRADGCSREQSLALLDDLCMTDPRITINGRRM